MHLFIKSLCANDNFLDFMTEKSRGHLKQQQTSERKNIYWKQFTAISKFQVMDSTIYDNFLYLKIIS